MFSLSLTASIARKVYLHGGIGVGGFRRVYGGSKRNGSRPRHFCKSSGSVPRHILQQLQSINIIEIDSKGGRRITSSGQRDLDQVAGRINAEVEGESFNMIVNVVLCPVILRHGSWVAYSVSTRYDTGYDTGYAGMGHDSGTTPRTEKTYLCCSRDLLKYIDLDLHPDLVTLEYVISAGRRRRPQKLMAECVTEKSCCR
ncbi:hypothetical protein KSS87_010038, partial [Heliosperma pusillum]